MKNVKGKCYSNHIQKYIKAEKADSTDSNSRFIKIILFKIVQMNKGMQLTVIFNINDIY